MRTALIAPTILLAALLVPAGCSDNYSPPSETVLEPAAPRATAWNDAAPTGDVVADYLKQHPDVLMSVLAEHKAELFEIVDAGYAEVQETQRRADWERQALEPTHVGVDDGRPLRGDAGAPRLIVEYSDFQCPYCARTSQTLKDFVSDYPGTFRLAFKHMPLPGHPQALPAAQYFEAAALQDEAAAWALHDTMFENQTALGNLGEEFILKEAEKLGLDLDKLKADAKGEAVKARILADMKEAGELGFTGAPNVIVSGIVLRGAPKPEYLDEVLALAEKYGATTLAPTTAETAGSVLVPESSQEQADTPAEPEQGGHDQVEHGQMQAPDAHQDAHQDAGQEAHPEMHQEMQQEEQPEPPASAPADAPASEEQTGEHQTHGALKAEDDQCTDCTL